MNWLPIDKFEDETTLEETEAMNVASGAIFKVTATEKSKMGNSPTIGMVFVPGLIVRNPDDPGLKAPETEPVPVIEEPTEENTAPEVQDQE